MIHIFRQNKVNIIIPNILKLTPKPIPWPKQIQFLNFKLYDCGFCLLNTVSISFVL